MLSGKTTNTNFRMFCLTWSGIEPTIYHSRGERTLLKLTVHKKFKLRSHSVIGTYMGTLNRIFMYFYYNGFFSSIVLLNVSSFWDMYMNYLHWTEKQLICKNIYWYYQTFSRYVSIFPFLVSLFPTPPPRWSKRFYLAVKLNIHLTNKEETTR